MENIYITTSCPHCKKEINRMLVDDVIGKSLSRFKIIHLLKKYKRLNITQLSDKVGISRPSVYHHINRIDNIEIEKNNKDKGKPVFVRLSKPLRNLNTSRGSK